MAQIDETRPSLERWRIAFLIAGILAALLAIFSFQLGISASKDLSTGKLALWITAGLLLGVGLLGRKTLTAYRGAALILLNTIVFLIAIEVGLTFLARLRDFLPGAQPGAEQALPASAQVTYVNDGREDLPYFDDKDWARPYWREYHAIGDQVPSTVFYPYILWRSQPFDGQTINVDDNGIRFTPGAECTDEAYTVYVFGGSTVWGVGVPDWGTIPALLQEQIAAGHEGPVCVVNYGEQAWVASQSLTQLMLLLQAGRVPNMVIFYDGVNDVFAAYQTGQAGVPQNLSRIEALFSLRPESPPLLQIVSRTRTYITLRRLLFGPATVDQQIVNYQDFGVNTNDMSESIASNYLGTLNVVSALAQNYDFDYAFFWQPVMLIDEKTLSEEEDGILGIAAGVHPGLTELYAASYQQVEDAAASDEHLHYIADIFHDHTELVYIDPWHITLEGNQQVVDEMLDMLSPLP